MNAKYNEHQRVDFWKCAICHSDHNTKIEAEVCCTAFAREHFQAGLKLGLRLAKQIVDCDNHARYYDIEKALEIIPELIKQSDGYPLTWQPPKEGESLL